MFGYVIPDKPNMLIRDHAEYKAYYCGLCVSLGKRYSSSVRLATNYDCAFLAAFLHNIGVNKPKVDNKACVLSPFKKHPIVVNDDIMAAVADVTVLLGYYKAEDDVLDEGGLKKRSARTMLASAKRRAAKRRPDLDAVIKSRYEELRALEAAGENSFDRAADPFSAMLRDIVRLLAGDNYTKEAGDVVYNVGKWVYAVDAVCDLEDDSKKGCYNPIIAALGAFTDKADYLTRFNEELSFILYSAYNAAVTAYNTMEVTVSEGVLSNILYRGLRAQTERVLKGEEQCNKTRI